MRMRKLGKGQAVTFLVPEEVELTIRRLRSIPQAVPISKVDVLSWTVWETWREVERSARLFAAQGARYWHQEEIWRRAKARSKRGVEMTPDMAEEFLENEARTLDEHYRPSTEEVVHGDPFDGRFEQQARREPLLKFIMETCAKFGALSKGAAASLEEEQEREVAPQVQEICEFPKPPSVQPYSSFVDPDVEHFVRTGELKEDSDAFQPAFEAFRHSSATHLIDPSDFPRDLLATRDFIQAVEPGVDSRISDQHYRPAHWVVSRAVDLGGGGVDRLVLFSPFEANKLLYLFRETKKAVLHLYAPRTNLSHRTLEDLTMCTTPGLPAGWTAPRRLVRLLNLFAGQLFL